MASCAGLGGLTHKKRRGAKAPRRWDSRAAFAPPPFAGRTQSQPPGLFVVFGSDSAT
jgi:hypothetical protein